MSNHCIRVPMLAITSTVHCSIYNFHIKRKSTIAPSNLNFTFCLCFTALKAEGLYRTRTIGPIACSKMLSVKNPYLDSLEPATI